MATMGHLEEARIEILDEIEAQIAALRQRYRLPRGPDQDRPTTWALRRLQRGCDRANGPENLSAALALVAALSDQSIAELWTAGAEPSDSKTDPGAPE